MTFISFESMTGSLFFPLPVEMTALRRACSDEVGTCHHSDLSINSRSALCDSNVQNESVWRVRRAGSKNRCSHSVARWHRSTIEAPAKLAGKHSWRSSTIDERDANWFVPASHTLSDPQSSLFFVFFPSVQMITSILIKWTGP